MKSVNPAAIPTADLHQYILGSVAPRPIAFASTINEEGQPNLAPFSFFNAYSSNPPMLVFSANRRVKGNTTKDTLHNVEATKEVVINICDYAMVRQMALASVEFPSTVNEFEKAGLTPLASEKIKPLRVKEAPVQFECLVKDIISLGKEGGAGNLILCEPVMIHLAEHLFDENEKIDPRKCDFIGRMGRAYYSRTIPESIFTVFQPVNKMALGFDQLPNHIKNSTILTGNELGVLAGLEALPSNEVIDTVNNLPEIAELKSTYSGAVLHQKLAAKARVCMANKEVEKAFALLM